MAYFLAVYKLLSRVQFTVAHRTRPISTVNKLLMENIARFTLSIVYHKSEARLWQYYDSDSIKHAIHFSRCRFDMLVTQQRGNEEHRF